MRLNFRLLIILIGLLGCTPEAIDLDGFDFDSPDSDIKIVVYGAIYSQKDRQPVILTKPGVWPDKGSNEPISGAKVSVSDGSMIYVYSESDQAGLYYSIDSIAGIVGKSYTLSVTYEGKTYQATDKMITLDTSTFELPVDYVDEEEGLYGIHVYSHNFGYRQPMRFMYNSMGNLDPNFPGVSDSLHLVQLLYAGHSDVMLHVGNIPQGILNSEKLLVGLYGYPEDTYLIYFMSISEGYYGFLLDLFNESDWGVGLFASQPGNLRTNLSNGALGYFYAADLKIRSYEMSDLIK